jgi:hypothetical protein
MKCTPQKHDRHIQLKSTISTFSKSMPYKFIGNDVSHTMVKEMPENDDTSSMYALKRRKEAKAADPIANPFVVAFVVFPTASSKSVISLTFSGCGHNDNAV